MRIEAARFAAELRVRWAEAYGAPPPRDGTRGGSSVA
jgi:hypothetical protein